MCASDNLVFVLQSNANGKGNKIYCLYYEDSEIKFTSNYNSDHTIAQLKLCYVGEMKESTFD